MLCLGNKPRALNVPGKYFAESLRFAPVRYIAVHTGTARRTFSPIVPPVLLARRLSTASLLSSSRLLSQTTASDWMDFQNLPGLSAEGRQKSLPACRGRGGTVLLQNEFLYWVITP